VDVAACFWGLPAQRVGRQPRAEQGVGVQAFHQPPQSRPQVAVRYSRAPEMVCRLQVQPAWWLAALKPDDTLRPAVFEKRDDRQIGVDAVLATGAVRGEEAGGPARAAEAVPDDAGKVAVLSEIGHRDEARH